MFVACRRCCQVGWRLLDWKDGDALWENLPVRESWAYDDGLFSGWDWEWEFLLHGIRAA